VTTSSEPTTVYVTVPAGTSVVELSASPTSTVTRLGTVYSSASYTQVETIPEPSAAIGSSNTAGAEATGAQSYETTITETALYTATQAYATSTPSGPPISPSDAANEPLSFIVEDGTTIWLNGPAPATTESYVVVTSAVTVLPVAASVPEHTSTLTVQSTIYETQHLTVTDFLNTAASTPPTSTFIPAGTGTIFTGVAPGGWNASSTASRVDDYSVVTPSTTSSENVMFAADSTFDIYETSHSTISLSAMSAKSGFNELTYTVLSPATTSSEITLLTADSTFDIYQTSHSTISLSVMSAKSGFNELTYTVSSPSTSIAGGDLTTAASTSSATSTGNGVWTTAVISGQTVSWGGPSTRVDSASVTSSTSSKYQSYDSSSTSSASDQSTFATSPSVTSSVGGVSASSSVATTFVSSTTTRYSTGYTRIPPFHTASSTVTNVTSSAAPGYSTGSTQIPPFRTASSSVVVNSQSSATTGYLTGSTQISPFHTASSSVAANFTSSTSTSTGYTTGSTQIPPFHTASSVGVYSTSSADTGYTTSPTQISPFHTASSSTVATSVPSTFTSSHVLPTSTPLYFNSSSIKQTATSSTVPTSTSPTASSTPSLCGEYGDFTLNACSHPVFPARYTNPRQFDDIPPLSISKQSANIGPEPVFNPYHQFDFSDGFTVVPPPTDPYLPSSPPLLLEFIADFNVNGTNPQAGPDTAEEGFSGQISNGDHALTGCFTFNAYGASFGCNSTGPDCDFTFTGLRYNSSSGEEYSVTSQNYSISACPALSKCTLMLIPLDNTFVDLNAIQINATVAGAPAMWWMDDLRLGWFNNSCTAGLCRQSAHIH